MRGAEVELTAHIFGWKKDAVEYITTDAPLKLKILDPKLDMPFSKSPEILYWEPKIGQQGNL